MATHPDGRIARIGVGEGVRDAEVQDRREPVRGHVVDLPVGSIAATAAVDNLIESRWIDDGTRALFMDVVSYCPNNDMFLATRLAFELLPTGNIESSMILEPAALLTDIRAIEGDFEEVSESCVCVGGGGAAAGVLCGG